ncbi:MAG TPA: prolyl oligopeptidase family serine peptidase [Polyangia bacterium]|nr:prolyl oligopeptidase family serine peptidase [Polyangia bacterium]
MSAGSPPADDPYRWLEDGEAPAVVRWTAAENAKTRRALDGLPGRAALAARFKQLYSIGSLGAPVSRPRGKGEARRYFYTRRDGAQNQPVLYVRDGLDGADRALVDVNQERADGTRALDWWFPSDDGARVAYGVSDDGSEESVLRVRDVAAGRDLADQIPRTRACSLAWTPDGGGFYYTRYPKPGEVPRGEEAYHRGVFLHRLGEDPARDRKIFGDGRDRTDWPGVDLSPGGRWLVITVSQGWTKSELYLADLADPRGDGRPRPLAAGEDARFEVIQALDDRLYLLTTSGAPRGRLFAVDPARPARAHWREVVPESEEVIESAAYFHGGLAVGSLHDAAARLRLFDADGRHRHEVPLPGLGALTALSAAHDAAELFYGFTGFLSPTAIVRVTPGAPPRSAVWRALPAPADAAAFEVERVMVTSRDGTRLPLFLAHKKGLPRDGTRPALLTGYGGFDVDMLPSWTPSALPFLESGGTYALAVLRGGGEYGESWHRAGMLGDKQNVFDDFIAAATWLVDARVTAPGRLAISGGSNGGLLVGAALTQRPDLFRAVVCNVPLLDMLRYHLFRLAQLWIPEYGSPDDPAARRWLGAYSPYQHVRDGVKYPAVYLHTAASDTRVDPMHARKMAARLQAATASGLPVLLDVESQAGHGAGKPLAKVIAQLVDQWSFLFWQLGITYEDHAK